MISGIMITATRLLIPRFYPSQATNGWANLFGNLSGGGVTLFALLAEIVSFLVEFGGVSIFIGGLLCYKKHLRSGKEFVGIGTTFGFADLLLAIPSLGSSSSGPIYLVVIAWTGLFFAVFAGRHIKGPKGSYASEVRKLVTGLRSRILRQEKRRKRERRLRRRRAHSKLPRGSLSPAKQYNVSGNKDSDS
jgi:hypothetical protein